MKKNTLILLSILFSSLSVFAAGGDYSPKVKPNIVKLNLMSLGFKNFGVQYERILGDKISVACQLRLMPKGSLIGASAINTVVDEDSVDVADFKAGSFAITPEFRFYPRHAGKGFYLAPYLRYRTMNFESPIQYTDDNGASQNVYAKGDFSSIIGGLMIGSQFRLGSMVTLDWFILGLQYGSTNVDVKVTNTETLSVNDQNDIKSNVDDVLSRYENIKTTIGPNGGTIEGTLGMLGFRGFGLNLGIRF
ncbi:MAG TPA: DUF3575 domain-containing protein [Chitinophagaceae bacterium]|nr:DUF3575 domain-containing protein [Chitinophagaceae bacterium]